VTLVDNPVGSLDRVETTATGRRALGWTLDFATVAPIQVELLVSTPAGLRSFFAESDLPRGDIGRLYPFYGEAHGFDVEIPNGGQVCAYGLNVGTGANRRLGCIT
jgi:hypothetical protein